MKRKVLAMLVPALLVAGAANAAEVYNKDGNKLDLYGKVAGLHYFSDDAGSDGDMSYARIGFKGETQIADQFTGYGQWEFNIGANGPESDKGNTATRLAFAGFGFGQNGTFDYGRNYGVVYDVEAWTDMLPEFGGDTYAGADNFMNGRANSVATYRNNGFFGQVDGLNFALQYQGNNEKSGLFDQEGSGNGNGRKLAKENVSLYIDLCNCLILICSIQHQMKVNLWTKNSYRLWLTNWPKTSKPLKTSVSLIGC
ncbi:outer membrane pore protein [Escherichia coli]|nr:outer membrane pore protein [Escherichia coli]